MEKQTILVVDDTPENIHVLNGILCSEYNILIATNGLLAIDIAKKRKPDLILLDIMMPELSGYEVCSILKSSIKTQKIPIIFVTAKNQVIDETKGLDLGAVDYIIKPVSAPIVLARVKTHLALYDQKRVLEKQVSERTKELNSTRQEIINRLSTAAEYKDSETGFHIIRMSKYCQLIALDLGLETSQAELILNATSMHDIGKIGIPDDILLKPSKLTDQEFSEMKNHCKYGAKIIGDNPSDLIKMAKEVALTHHEKWNGKGYPNNLKGEAIPLVGRIAAIADVFDALTSKRPYKEAWSVDDAVSLIKKEKGEHFDPRVVDSFLNVLPQIIEIKNKFSDESKY